MYVRIEHLHELMERNSARCTVSTILGTDSSGILQQHVVACGQDVHSGGLCLVQAEFGSYTVHVHLYCSCIEMILALCNLS